MHECFVGPRRKIKSFPRKGFAQTVSPEVNDVKKTATDDVLRGVSSTASSTQKPFMKFATVISTSVFAPSTPKGLYHNVFHQ